jgi:hypothetical protein
MVDRDALLLAGAPLGGYRFLDLCMEDGRRLDLAIAAGAVEAEGWHPGAASPGLRVSRSGGSEPVEGPADGRAWQVACCVAGFAGPCDSPVLDRVEEAFIGRIPLRSEADLPRLLARFSTRAPHWLVHGLCRTDAGVEADFILARSARFHQGVADERSRLTPPGTVAAIDVEASGRAGALWASVGEGMPAILQLRREIASLGTERRFALLPPLRTAVAALAALPRDGEHFGSRRYWTALLRGLVALLEIQEVDAENPYVGFLRRGVREGTYDPMMAGSLATDAAAVARLGPRLQRFLDILDTRRLDHPAVAYNPLPREPGEGAEMDRLVLTDGSRWRVGLMDGNHRLAALWLAGAPACPCHMVWNGQAADVDAGTARARAMLALAGGALPAA